MSHRRRYQSIDLPESVDLPDFLVESMKDAMDELRADIVKAANEQDDGLVILFGFVYIILRGLLRATTIMPIVQGETETNLEK